MNFAAIQKHMISQLSNRIFQQVIDDYHKQDHVDAPLKNPYTTNSLEHILYHKCWIDTVQWHLEDIVRNPEIDPEEGLKIKRRIDASNQERTDMVEQLDQYFREKFSNVKPLPEARINTESPAWAIDRLSILALKIYHMKIETERSDVSEAHIQACSRKLAVLELQQIDLSTAIDELLQDIEEGRKKMRVYQQMKMYNDPSLNPVLYAQKNTAGD